jgi:hypothetical protein
MNPEQLREIGDNSTNVESAWAGAADSLAKGLKVWTRMQIGRDRTIAVRAAVAACALVVERYAAAGGNPGDSGIFDALPPRDYVDDMLAAIRRWLDEPSKDHAEAVRSMLDVTRSAHAWQRERDVASFWILEAVDHASLAVWSGAQASYIVPMDYATCAARAVACVLHAMLDLKTSEDQAVTALVGAVQSAL